MPADSPQFYKVKVGAMALLLCSLSVVFAYLAFTFVKQNKPEAISNSHQQPISEPQQTILQATPPKKPSSSPKRTAAAASPLTAPTTTGGTSVGAPIVKEFSYKQAIQIKNATDNLHLSPVAFIIGTREDKKDRSDYANALQRAFRDAGWPKVNEHDVWSFGEDPKGIAFLLDDMGQTIPSSSITKALDAANIKYWFDKELHPGTPLYLDDLVRAGFFPTQASHLPVLWIGSPDE